MGSTFFSLHYHVVFSTKDRVPSIVREWRERLHEYIGGALRTMDAVSLGVGGVEDHVHVLVGAKPKHAPADLVREIKKASSTWVRDHFARSFTWQEGYGIFSVSRANIDAVRRYIASQEDHHRKRTFQEEYLAFLEELAIEYDPRYLW